MILAVTGRPSEAAEQFRAAQQITGGAYPSAEFYLGWCLRAQGHVDAARQQYLAARQRFPPWPEMARQAAWPLATHHDLHSRNGSLALLWAQVINQALNEQDPAALDLHAAAHAELEHFDEAKTVGRHAAELARQNGKSDLAVRIEARVRGYESRQPA